MIPSSSPLPSPAYARAAVPPLPVAERVPVWLWLGIGIVLTAASGNRWNIALAGWIAPVSFLLAAPRLRGWRGALLLLAALTVATTLQTLKIISAPLPPATALMFGVPLGISAWLMLLLWVALRRRVSAYWALYGYVALAVLFDWLNLAFSPAGAWAASATSQFDDLPLLQLAALGGLTLIGALMALVAANLAYLLESRPPRMAWRHPAAALIVLLAALGWGSARLDCLDSGPTLAAAGIVTHLGLANGIPDAAALAANTRDLLVRSEIAAQRGARLVVWNEVATLVDPEDETVLRTRGAGLARRHGIDFVMAYGVLLRASPLLIDNKYEWFGPDGASLEIYRKHHPVPGEPSLRGEAPIKALDRPWGRAAGAICYDYDFVSMGLAHARAGAGLIVLPGSDWRGIDPYHTLMARVRGIEGGMSVLRPVRDATSMAFDAYGRVRSSLGAWERNDGIMSVELPTRQIPTLYARLGEWPALLAAGFLLLACMKVWRRR